MQKMPLKQVSYFPGCSLASTARENNESLKCLFEYLGIQLIDLPDWNCCGSSSAHSISTDIAFDLAGRNLSLAPPGRPLLVACPSCLLRLRQAQLKLNTDPRARQIYETAWGRPFDEKLKIVHFFEMLDGMELTGFSKGLGERLDGLRIAPYYGCMLARPPALRHEKNYHGLMEKVLSSMGAVPVRWAYASRCCGTFLTVARPDIVTPMVDEIIEGAQRVRADCIVTACAMCHLNLEARCSLKEKVPVLHFSEVMSLALGLGGKRQMGWFGRHLVDPRPLLRAMHLLG